MYYFLKYNKLKLQCVLDTNDLSDKIILQAEDIIASCPHSPITSSTIALIDCSASIASIDPNLLPAVLTITMDPHGKKKRPSPSPPLPTKKSKSTSEQMYNEPLMLSPL